MGSKPPPQTAIQQTTAAIASVPVVGTVFTLVFGDENAVEKKATTEADAALTQIETVPEFNCLIVLLKRMIGTLEKFKCNEIPAKQFRIMMMQVRRALLLRSQTPHPNNHAPCLDPSPRRGGA
jgi:hypothetical protein